MMASLDSLLQTYRKQTATEREKGTAFEKLIAVWLMTDPVQKQHFQRAELWADWARRTNRDRSDVGIDIVGTLRDGNLAAIQCKFYDAQRSIQKSDIDSFISASAKHDFSERIIVETTEKPWSKNAEAMLHRQALPTRRIGIRDLRASEVDWSEFAAKGRIRRKTKPKTLRCDQMKAFDAVIAGLKAANRGKLIMACGTGKTLVGLRIAERLAGTGGSVLLLVPSLALASQTIREWCANALVPLASFAVCSDTKVGKRRRSREDVAEIEVSDLELPATTEPNKLAAAFEACKSDSMRVIFATYQSISVISDAQHQYRLPDFDLIICDEAHRTTGVTLTSEDESNFVKVHDNTQICAGKRLYMTATPRIYGENAKSKAKDADATLASMDDPKLYGDYLYHYGFAEAVENNILSDYRVIVLAMDEGQVSAAVQNRLADGTSELQLDDATKIIGCYKALSKEGLNESSHRKSIPMRRALAFCRGIEPSKLVCAEFNQVVEQYISNTEEEPSKHPLGCEVKHVDGTYNARERADLLDWLKADAEWDTCRILSNAKCLTEGVDVPALDAILFLHPRKSQIDVVQAVGRVMRKAKGKHTGYVVLPVGIPPGVLPEEALRDNRKYQVIWQILNALRSHDERLDAVINQGGLGQDVSDRISIVDGRSIETSRALRDVTAVVYDFPARSRRRGSEIGEGGAQTGDGGKTDEPKPRQLVIDEFSKAVMAKIVEKCGTRHYWEDWAKDVADIAQAHITRITALIEQDGSDAQEFFDDFLKELRDDLNESITDSDAIEMLAQHLITRPVFEALFEDYAFVDRNPISRSMSEVLSVVDEANVSQEARGLEGFYASVRRRAEGVTDPAARQKLVVELYDTFFRGAFPLTTQKLGIVYTPVEIVDFIIRSVDEVLGDEFDSSLGTEGVHIIDPFVGTGTFITRLMQSGLIAPGDLERKYRHEFHANEIVLLAYYIAAINIETVFHGTARHGESYVPFNGICLTDTFALHEGTDELSFYMKDNSDRRERQKQTPIQVVIGNPPYSVGQKNANDDARNVAHSQIVSRIRDTYARRSATSTLQALYDSYIRAIRWGSDRIGDRGVMAFVTNAGWLEANAMDGMRKCIAEEFSSVHVFHLRGNQRTIGEESRREGGKIFGSGSRAPIAISIFVKNPAARQEGRIMFHDIGDYLDQKQKLTAIRNFGSIGGIARDPGWRHIVPDQHGDWLNQRDSSFSQFLKIGDKKVKDEVLFADYSGGLQTSRDEWCFNPSKAALRDNLVRGIRFFNREVKRVHEVCKEDADITKLVDKDKKKFKWDKRAYENAQKRKELEFDQESVRLSTFRPFTKCYGYMNRDLNWSVMKLPRVFPNENSPNRAIAVTGKGGRSGFSCLMLDALPNLHTIDTGQCFPLHLYDRRATDKASLFSNAQDAEYQRRDAITDFGLQYFQSAYPAEIIRKVDIFHYVYGLLHSEDYRERYKNNLTKELPRIPCVKSPEDFRSLRDAGQRLGELHADYESVEPYPAEIDTRGKSLDDMSPEVAYRVEKMRHPKIGKQADRTTVIYNPHVTVRDIPEPAYEYVVNGKPALNWVMERQVIRTDKASGIVSDANRYAIETVGNPRYPLDLFLRVITVSLETMKIVRSLPSLSIARVAGDT